MFLSVKSLICLLQLLHLFLGQTSTLYYKAQLCHFCHILESPEGSWPKESISDYNVPISVIYGLPLYCINLKNVKITNTRSIGFIKCLKIELLLRNWLFWITIFDLRDKNSLIHREKASMTVARKSCLPFPVY